MAARLEFEAAGHFHLMDRVAARRRRAGRCGQQRRQEQQGQAAPRISPSDPQPKTKPVAPPRARKLAKLAPQRARARPATAMAGEIDEVDAINARACGAPKRNKRSEPTHARGGGEAGRDLARGEADRCRRASIGELKAQQVRCRKVLFRPGAQARAGLVATWSANVRFRPIADIRNRHTTEQCQRTSSITP
jgi:hypothetical protein